MTDVSATIRLRPTRIALLVRPTDFSAIRKFMRVSACLWGGIYNPIVPVFRSYPKDWSPVPPEERHTGAEVARGYINFFEPDAYVEAEPDLLKKIGLDAIYSESLLDKRVFPLKEFLTCEMHRDYTQLAAGLGIVDALKHVYETKLRFKQREEHPAILVKPSRGSTIAEAMFGVYPTDKPSMYIAQAYSDVFKPTSMDETPDAWITVYKDGAVTPFRMTEYKLEAMRSWHHDLVIYVFDPTKGTDLIDLWNLRLQSNPLLPIPIGWWPDLADEVGKTIMAQFRPLQGNPNGVMHHTTIEFARSINEEQRDELLANLSPDLPRGSYAHKAWRDRVWEQHAGEGIFPKISRLQITAKERRITLKVQDNDSPKIDFQTLEPEFSSFYVGSHHARWVNSINLNTYPKHHIATVLPFNVTDPSWPSLDYIMRKRVVIGTEGWSFVQRFKDDTQTIQFLTQEEAIIGSLKQLGIEANLSEPGRIAKQVFQSFGGMHNIHLLADSETLEFLNKMAGGVRKRGKGEVEEVFNRRTMSAKKVSELMARRNQREPWVKTTISSFTDCNVLSLGLTTECPHCSIKNWHSLTDTDYEIVCERCLKHYPFPQGTLKAKNGNWSYRVIGPFSAPDYARGSYGVLLALRVLHQTCNTMGEMTFSPSLEIEVDEGPPCEADYVAWIPTEASIEALPPKLVIGEAKSFGRGNLIKPHDLTQLRRIAGKLPSAIIVISVMRDSFTAGEKRILSPFIRWAQRLNKKTWAPTNPVILLTGVELFYEVNLDLTWREKGGRHAEFASHHHTHNLRMLAEATQEIYLD